MLLSTKANWSTIVIQLRCKSTT